MGEEIPGSMTEMSFPLRIASIVEFWPWYPVLHPNENLSTFLVTDLRGNLLIYTFDKSGERICAEVHDITGFTYYRH